MPKKIKIIKEETPRIKIIKELSQKDISSLIDKIQDIDKKFQSKEILPIKFTVPPLKTKEVEETNIKESQIESLVNETPAPDEAPKRDYSTNFEEINRNTYYRAPVLEMDTLSLKEQAIQQNAPIRKPTLVSQESFAHEKYQKDNYQTEKQKRRIYPWET